MQQQQEQQEQQQQQEQQDQQQQQGQQEQQNQQNQQEQQDQTSVIQLALQEYEQGMNDFAQKMPKIFNQFNDFMKECFAEGAISKKHKQLIALSISVYTQDEYSIIFHTKSCVDLGCSEEEILDALSVTMAFGGGTTMSQAVTLVQEAYQHFHKNSNNHVQ